MRHKVVAVGEVLWDLLPGGKQLGGAPANFTYHARALGAEEWRRLMTPVRQAAIALAREGRVLVLRKGRPASPDALAEGAKGVIRLAAPETGP